MSEMIVYKTPIAVFVPLDSDRQPDLSRVPSDERVRIVRKEWSYYPVITSYDREVFDEVSERGFSLRKTYPKFGSDEIGDI